MNASPTYKIAFDLGTTTLAARLLSATGGILAEAQVPNPQQEVATDILQRLQLAHEQGGAMLQSLLVGGMRALLGKLLDQANCVPGEIAAVAAAGNPGMSCLLRNLPLASLLNPPHKPPYKKLVCVPSKEVDLGLSQPIELFPLASGFVGGDLVACLLSLDNPHPGTLLIDIGTNAELAIWDGCRWWVTSAAAGPAFEGGNIGTGMIMANGAVSNVSLDGDHLRLVVVGGGQPRGLCGSGLAALVAAARQGGLLDATGRILSPDEVETNLARCLVQKEDSWAIRFHLSATVELLLTQEDLRNFQLAKGAVLAGTQVLLDRGGFKPDNVRQVLLTGALGTSLSIEVLKRVALLPEPMLDKTSFVTNGVLAGLQSYLLAADGQQRLKALVDTIQPFPLSGTPAFERLFLASLEF